MAKQVDAATPARFSEFNFTFGAHAHVCGFRVQNGRDCGDNNLGRKRCYYHDKIERGMIRPSG